jgi:streptomycin 6-kinase
MQIPRALAEEWGCDRDWVANLPRLAAECAERWRLVLEEPFDTPRSLVVPAGDLVLKLNAPGHYEADDEAEALARWEGSGAVRLIERDDGRRALLIERCRPGTRLADSAVDEHAVVADLLPRLHIQPSEPHPFRSLADEAERWADEVPRRYERAGRPFERSLVDFAVNVFHSVDPTAVFLVDQDLHGGNILRAAREPWLVIDPKPVVGELELNGVGVLRNAAWRGGTATVRRWLDVLEELGLDRERLRAWGTAHALAWGWDEERRWSAQAIDAARAIVAA